MDTTNIFIISGPAGSGKDTIIKQLGNTLSLERIVTTTTRKARDSESEGNPYHFVSQDAFAQGIRDDLFAEYSVNENNAFYGVSKAELKRVSEQTSKIGIWQIDWKGVLSAKKLFPGIQAILIIAPLPILEQRLRSRDLKHNESYFEERMSYTQEWLKHKDIYDYVVENEQGQLERTVQSVQTIILSHSPVTPV